MNLVIVIYQIMGIGSIKSNAELDVVVLRM